MINQPVFLRILIPERDDHLLNEITLHSLRIVLEFKDVVYYVFDDNIYYIDDDWGIMLAHLWCVMNQWLLTLNYDIRRLTLFEPIFNNIVARRTWKRVCHGEDGEEHENKCKGFGDSEVHWHVSIIETVSRCVCLEVGASVFHFSSWLFLSYCPLSQRCPSHENCL